MTALSIGCRCLAWCAKQGRCGLMLLFFACLVTSVPLRGQTSAKTAATAPAAADTDAEDAGPPANVDPAGSAEVTGAQDPHRSLALSDLV